MTDKHIDDVSGVATTGHEWDGIRELDNPMPRWWLWTFYATIVWAIAYTVAYPAWPLLTSATKGVLNYSSRGEIKQDMAAAGAAQEKYLAAIQSKTVAEIDADEKLREFASAAGAATFRVNCVQCHGSGAQGSPGFPNLNDDEWLWGGSAEQIYKTITHGIRFADDSDTHTSEMPPFGDVLNAGQITDVSIYVASLSGPVSDASRVADGAKVYTDNCAACHGGDARGNRDLGAPNLTDAIWLYGSGERAIAAQVRAPKNGVMPAWGARLGDVKVKELSVYVHSLGGGE